MTWFIAFLVYIGCGFCMGQLLGFSGVIDILLFPISAIIKISQIYDETHKDDNEKEVFDNDKK